MDTLLNLDLVLSFLITWLVILIPPTLIRILRRKPLSKWISISLCVVFYFANIIIFVMLGSQSKNHFAVLIGAMFSFYVLRFQTDATAAKAAIDHRKSLGYDE